ncbi:MAG: IS701 family transposase, partial [Candidatus Rokubacteria bacterium]|nr:IS701 family transposase [Candidatus Rokubacteria bacterium]
SWARDQTRRRTVGVPTTVRFRPKWQIALAQIRALHAEGVPLAPVVADAAYGVTIEFRAALTAQQIPYVLGVREDTMIWPPGYTPPPPRRGRLPRHLRGRPRQHPIQLGILVGRLPVSAWSTVTWREGTRGRMRSRFVALRVRPAPARLRAAPRPVEWLLSEWPLNEPAPTKHYLSTLPASTSLADLVRLAHLRWRIERDYQELKDEFGLDHFEGRGWRGFHHHGSLCIAAYAFLAAERARLSPPEPLSFLRPARLPKGFTPRGAPGAA